MNQNQQPGSTELDKIEAIIDSTVIFRHSAEGKAVGSLLKQVREAIAASRRAAGGEVHPIYQIQQLEFASTWADVSKAEFDASRESVLRKRIVYRTAPAAPASLPDVAMPAPFAYVTTDRKHIVFGDRIKNSEAVKSGMSPLYLAAQPAEGSAQVATEPFGIYVERNDGTTEFRRTGNAFSPTAQGYKFWTLYAGPIATPAAVVRAAPAEQFDEAVANLLAEHTNLTQDGIDEHAMRIVLALNYAALRPVTEESIAEWREQGYLDSTGIAAEGATQALVQRTDDFGNVWDVTPEQAAEIDALGDKQGAQGDA